MSMIIHITCMAIHMLFPILHYGYILYIIRVHTSVVYVYMNRIPPTSKYVDVIHISAYIFIKWIYCVRTKKN